MRSSPEYLRETEDGIEVQLLVVPNSSRSEIVGTHGGRLKIKVSAPPEEGRANKAVIELLRRRLDVKGVSLVIGESSREKVVIIKGVDLSELIERLEAVSND